MNDSSPELNQVFSLVYEELKAIARRVRRGGSGVTMNTTALVHETWLKLQTSRALRFESESHFKSIAAIAIRQILFDAARRRDAMKRGGAGEAILISFDDSMGEVKPATDEETIGLEMALRKLAKLSPRQVRVVECRFYGMMNVEETGKALGVSKSVVERDWRAAKAWLAAELGGKR